jgi:tetrahydromethanopterin S-methyltransferase subunit G
MSDEETQALIERLAEIERKLDSVIVPIIVQGSGK